MIYSPQKINFIGSTNNFLLTSGVIFVFLFILNLFTLFIPLAFYSVLAFFGFSLFAVSLLKFSPFSFILLLHYLLLRLTVLLSGVVIEYGALITELNAVGEATGAFTRVAMVMIFFSSVCALFIENYKQRILSKAPRLAQERTLQTSSWVTLFFVGVLMLLLYVLGLGVIKGFPILEGVSRFYYRREIDDFIFYQFLYNRIIIAVLLGLIFVKSIGNRKLFSLGFFACMVFVSILFSEKFTSITEMIIFFIIPSFLVFPNNQKKLFSRTLSLGMLITIITIPIILIVYGWQDSQVEAIDTLLSRIAAQGQLWFIVDRDTSDLFSWNNQQIIRTILSFFAISPKEEIAMVWPYVGMRHLILQYGDLNIALYY